ncbi:N-glycosylase/DNA lyase [Candidatus Woesearchaeota archaeon]|nr:N-glycosylase/DNA lyase [Candidatus Woesearchaeota archaeon]
MEGLIRTIKELRKSRVKKEIDKKLRIFSSFKDKSNNEWFSELCFCILTANSKAKTAIAIQKELTASGFCTMCLDDIRGAIKRNKHRFHNNKARFIVEARKNINIKDIIKPIADSSEGKGQIIAREWLVKNVKGLGYKEASHLLRNVGYFDLAVLDRHILNLMKEDRIIKEKPKSLTKKTYLEIEEKFRQLATKLGMSCAELDLYMWSMKTGRVLK